ncbi:hypothetical protein B0H15DRAFT_825071 [Mycena belliarum]|uniref:BTB domain-containing protein n=1 Tax=Mycena belliarum TaxID=1033014 RepID=A0AAD6UCF3_9AGAR|nr:hypothetical protein B0H15DRAFT_825071 [Mycena belliae]
MDTTIVDADAPFSPSYDDMNPSDLILRSCDSVDFHVHKAILSFSSQFFRDMLAFPQPDGEEANPMRNGKAIVDLPESEKAVEKLLILCYPRFAENLFTDLDGVDEAYPAADKYQVKDGQKVLEGIMAGTFLSQEPHRVYAIACHRGLAQLAKSAAAATLKLPLDALELVLIPEYKVLSAYQLLCLQILRSRCIGALQHRIEAETLARDAWEMASQASLKLWWDDHGHSVECGPYDVDDGEDERCFCPAKWFKKHIASIVTQIRTWESVDPESVAKALVKVEGSTMEVMAQCPRCRVEGPTALHWFSMETVTDIKQSHSIILAQFSFVD